MPSPVLSSPRTKRERQQTAAEIQTQLGEVRLDLLLRQRGARNAG